MCSRLTDRRSPVGAGALARSGCRRAGEAVRSPHQAERRTDARSRDDAEHGSLESRRGARPARRGRRSGVSEKLDGFNGMTLLTDRQTGKTIAVTFWESEDALRQSEEAVKDARGGPRNLAAPASRRWSASRSSSTRWLNEARFGTCDLEVLVVVAFANLGSPSRSAELLECRASARRSRAEAPSEARSSSVSRYSLWARPPYILACTARGDTSRRAPALRESERLRSVPEDTRLGRVDKRPLTLDSLTPAPAATDAALPRRSSWRDRVLGHAVADQSAGRGDVQVA